MILGQPTPVPGVGASIELSGRDARGLLDLIRVGKTLPGKRITAEEVPLAFLQVQPECSFRNEDVVEPRMPSHPGTGLGAVMAGEAVSDHEVVAGWIVGFYVGMQGDVVRRVAQGGTPGQLLVIAHAQRAIDPGFLRAAAVIQQRFDTVPTGRPAGRWREGAGHY